MSGGLEVASDRLLALMKKGVTVAQVARVARAFSDAGVLVHAYLMYGFPTETEQETVDALERVRQLFAEGCIQSAFWHRFAATAHSPIGQRPELFGVRLGPEAPVTFARNEVPFIDPTGCDHERLGPGLRKAIYNFMHGVGLDEDVRTWFDDGAPAPRRPAPSARAGAEGAQESDPASAGGRSGVSRTAHLGSRQVCPLPNPLPQTCRTGEEGRKSYSVLLAEEGTVSECPLLPRSAAGEG